MSELIDKICIWCGRPFKGYSSRMFCGNACAGEYRELQEKLRKAGKSTSREIVVMHHKELVKKEIEDRKLKVSLKPVHVTSRSVQWRYVKER